MKDNFTFFDSISIFKDNGIFLVNGKYVYLCWMGDNVILASSVEYFPIFREASHCPRLYLKPFCERVCQPMTSKLFFILRVSKFKRGKYPFTPTLGRIGMYQPIRYRYKILLHHQLL